jgi:hypothetical protein
MQRLKDNNHHANLQWKKEAEFCMEIQRVCFAGEVSGNWRLAGELISTLVSDQLAVLRSVRDHKGDWAVPAALRSVLRGEQEDPRYQEATERACKRLAFSSRLNNLAKSASGPNAEARGPSGPH